MHHGCRRHPRRLDGMTCPPTKGFPVTKNRARPLLGAAVATLLLVASACGSDSATTSSSSSSGGSAATFTFTPLDVGGPNTNAALTKGDIHVALLVSSDGAIPKNGWVALGDNKKRQTV